MARPGDNGALPATTAANAAEMTSSRSEPVRPHTNASPNRKIAELNEPSRKYLIAPSVEYESVLWKPASRYPGRTINSRPRKRSSRSPDAEISIAPVIAKTRIDANSATGRPRGTR